MYEAFYGLRERPFNLTPDPKYLYLSAKHKEAFAHLLYGIKNRSGFVMISGEIGTGKTMLCRNMLSQMDPDTQVAFIFNPFLNSIELLKKINREFGVASESDTILALTEDLSAHLLRTAADGKNSVLVIDEAQNLAPQVLEQIRLLSNLETDSEKLLQIILIGQPELAEKLALYELRQLNQRITARYHLKSLNAHETLEYIAYRIHVAGGSKRLNFTKGAVRRVYRYSGGVPRMINAVCDRALLIGYTQERYAIDASIVRRAAREIRGENVAAPAKPRLNWKRLAPSPALAILAVTALLLAHYLSAPLDRFARELHVFNQILAGNTSGGPSEESSPAPSTTPTDTRGVDASTDVGQAPEELGALQLIVERLNEATSPQANQTLAAIVAENDDGHTLRVGVDALLSLWNQTRNEEYPDDVSAEALAAFFKKHELACELLHPDADQLLRINMPGLVRMTDGDSDIWMGIVGADNEDVILKTDADKTIAVARAEFDAYYGREFLAPWRDPSPDASVLLPGHRGRYVRTFKEQLHVLGRLDAADLNDVYDKTTEEAVIAIQRETGLTKDGLAGPQVRLTLTSWLGHAPALRRDDTRPGRHSVDDSVTPVETATSEPPRTDTIVELPEAETVASAAADDDAALYVLDYSDSGNGQFQSVAGSVADVELRPLELPVMSLPEALTPEYEETSQYDGRGLFRLLREQSDRSVVSGEEQAPNDENVLMEVRELPKPFAPASSARENDSITPPVFGSAPLTPREEVQP